MSTIQGAFDETILLNLRARADQIMFDDRIKQQFIPQINAIEAVKAAQTATVLQGNSRTKKRAVDVFWDNYCDIVAEDNEDCIIGGNESSTNLQEYDVTWSKVVQMSFDEENFIDNEFDVQEHIAKGFLKAEKELAEEFAQYCVAQIDAFCGTNEFTGGKGDVVATDTYIEAAYWNAALVAYFNRVATLNRFTSPIFLSGANLYEQMLVARYNAGNDNGKGDAAMYAGINMFFDLFNVDQVNDPDLKTYMISTGALAMGNRYYHLNDIPMKYNTFWRWRIPFRWVPGFYLDVYQDDECVADLLKFGFKVKLQADVWNNPTGCTETNTGVLSFTCGESD